MTPPRRLLHGILLASLCCSTGCGGKHWISWADITLRNYRDMPGLAISAGEWKRCAHLYAEEAGGKTDEERESRRLFCEGKAAQAVGQTEQARALLEEAGAADPAWALPYEALGSLELENGKFEKAGEMFSKAYALDPMWTSPLADLGVTLHHLGMPLEALQAFDKAVEIDPSQGYLHSNRANVLTELGRYDEAVKAHLEAITLEPQNPVFYLNFAATLEEIGDMENQLWVQEKLKALLPESQKVVCILNIARLLDKMGRSEEALAEYKKALVLSPDLKAARDALKAFYFDHELYAHLIDFIVETSTEGCEACAHECLALGNILLDENNLEGAQKSYEAALAIRPDWVDPCLNLGIVHYRKHNYAKALELFGKVLEASPDDVSALVNAAMAHYRSGSPAEAAALLAKATTLKPDMAVAWSNYGEVLRFQGDFKAAASMHAKAFAINPTSCQVIAQYARMLVDQKKTKEAEAMAGKEPAEICALLHLSRAMLNEAKKTPGEAMKEVEKAIALDNALAEAHALRGLLLLKKGDKQKAKDDLSSAVCMEERIAKEKRYQPALKKLKIPPGCEKK